MTRPISRPRRALLSVVLPGLGIALACTGIFGAKTMSFPAKPALPDPAAAAADPNVRKVAAANTDFGFRLLAQLETAQPDKNIFFSPFSITEALTMTLNGADGSTKQVMQETLGLAALPQEDINQAHGLLLPSLTNPDPEVEISIANALWAAKGVTFAPGFSDRCRRFYGADATSLDFKAPSAADTINGWIKGKTQGKIDKLVSAEDLALSPAVLTNAVYFHGKWGEPFDKSSTRDGVFTLSNGTTKTVPLMSRAFESVSTLETPQFQAAALPYGAGRLKFYVFLPKPGTDVDRFAGSLTAEQWQQWMDQMHPAALTLFLPRFKAEYEARLKDPLTALGMGAAFGPGANFEPMGFTQGFIGDVVHKAVLDVDEEGTTAAAATAVIMSRSAIMRPNPVMRVDRPFFCALRDTATGTVLFAGIIRDPQ